MEQKHFDKFNIAGKISTKRIGKHNLPFFLGWIGILV